MAKHGITYVVPIRPCDIYFVYANGFQKIVYWDPVLKHNVPTRDIFIRSGAFIQGKKLIDNQSDLLNEYLDGTVQMGYYVPNKCRTVLDVTAKPRHCRYQYYNGTSWITIGNFTITGIVHSVDKKGHVQTYMTTVDEQSLVDIYTSDGEIIYDRRLVSRVVNDLSLNTPVYQISVSTVIVAGKTARNKVESLTTTAIKMCSITQVDIESFLISIGAVTHSFKAYGHTIPSNLLDRVYDNLILAADVNSIANIKDLKKIKELVPPLKQLVAKHNIKSLANLWLWWKYSYSTTRMDLFEYIKFFTQALSTSLRATSMCHFSVRPSIPVESCSLITKYTIRTNTFNAGVLTRLGFDINYTNTWDLIPFSFVLDWFINFGDIFSRLDTQNLTSKIDVLYCTISTNSVETFYPDPNLCAAGVISRHRYYRTTSRDIPTPDIKLELKNPIIHSLDGLALFVSNKR